MSRLLCNHIWVRSNWLIAVANTLPYGLFSLLNYYFVITVTYGKPAPLLTDEAISAPTCCKNQMNAFIFFKKNGKDLTLNKANKIYRVE
jgi:hypothetical protein